MWLDNQYKSEEWSCHSNLDQLSMMLRAYRFPSTTARRPRSLLIYKKFKANELRMVLLFGFAIFKGILQQKYYNHLLKLVLAFHLAENRAVTSSMVVSIKRLLRSFLFDFPKLYSLRHNQQVVHSLDHIGKTVEDFGPLTSYSTFHFENALGTQIVFLSKNSCAFFEACSRTDYANHSGHSSRRHRNDGHA